MVHEEAIVGGMTLSSKIPIVGDLQSKVLHYLKDHGPTMWNALYVSFDQERTGTIGPVLQDLKEWKYIEVGLTDRVKITMRGLEYLKGGKKQNLPKLTPLQRKRAKS
jgi:hypothetical protein